MSVGEWGGLRPVTGEVSQYGGWTVQEEDILLTVGVQTKKRPADKVCGALYGLRRDVRAA
ncbi:hypothetical protein JCM16814_13240 [Desulfobaculum senezii]